MNHSNICLAWMAFNMGVDRLHTTIGRRSKARDVTIIVKPEARASRIRYDGPIIYSHNWWAMARFTRGRQGEPVVMYRNASYSKSTGKHQNHVRDAVRANGDQVLFISIPWTTHGAGFEPQPNEVFDALIGVVTEKFNKALRAHTQMAHHLAAADHALAQMRVYSEVFGAPQPVWLNPFEKDPAAIVKLETKLTELGIREGLTFNPFWRRS